MHARAFCPYSSRRGLTLVEVLVAVSLALILIFTSYHMFQALTRSVGRAEEDRLMMGGIRAVTESLQRDLECAVVKAGYRPDGGFKALDGGLFRLQWPHAPGAAPHLRSDHPDYARYQDGRCRYLGFYTSGDRERIERVEYYFNPGEASALRFNRLDDDGDQPGGTGALVDDSGSLMLRRVSDADLAYDACAEAFPAAPPALQPGPPWLTGHPGNAGGSTGGDDGTILVNDLEDVTFRFLYTRRERPGDATTPVAPRFEYADRWPFDAEEDLETPGEASWAEDSTGERWPRTEAGGRRPKGLSYLCLPLAVEVRIEYSREGIPRVYAHTMVLPGSQWHEFLTREE